MSNSARRKIVELHAEIESLRQQLTSADESLKDVEKALAEVGYKGSYADGVMYLKGQLAKTQDEFHFQACLTKDLLPYQERAIKSEQQLAAALAACEQYQGIVHVATNTLERTGNLDDANRLDQMLIAIKPDASALRQHDEALIEQCAVLQEQRSTQRHGYAKHGDATAIRELKGEI